MLPQSSSLTLSRSDAAVFAQNDHLKHIRIKWKNVRLIDANT